jgi:hypothetical protein
MRVIAASEVCLREGADVIEQDSSGTAVVLVVVEDALFNGGIAGLGPAMEPFDRGGARAGGVPPSEAKILGERLFKFLRWISPVQPLLQ